MSRSAIRNLKSKVVVIGVGNDYRSDDAAGLIVARRLREIVADDVGIIEHSGEGASLIESLHDSQVAIIIDAVHSGAKPGTIFRLNATEQPIPTGFFYYSSHAFNVAEAVELARALGQLPNQLVIYGIEGKSFEAGEALSSEVQRAVDDVLARVGIEIHSMLGTLQRRE